MLSIKKVGCVLILMNGIAHYAVAQDGGFGGDGGDGGFGGDSGAGTTALPPPSATPSPVYIPPPDNAPPPMPGPVPEVPPQVGLPIGDPDFNPTGMPAPPGEGTGGILTLAGLPAVGTQGSVSDLPPALQALYSEKHYAYMQRCDGPAKRILDLYVDLYGLQRATSLTNDEQVRVIDEYDESCLQQVASAPASVQAFIESRIGVLYDSDAQKFLCTGIRIASQAVLTARHCVASRDGTEASLPDLRYYPTSSPADGYGISSIIATGPNLATGGFDDDGDFAILALDRALPSLEEGGVDIRDAAVFQGLIAAGLNEWLIYRDALRDPQSPAQSDNGAYGFRGWLRYVRIDDAASCMVAATDSSGCIHHACQTSRGMSGAALLASSEDGELALVGMGTRATFSDDSGLCAKEAPEGVPNIGLSISGSQIQATMQAYLPPQ